MKTEEEWKKAGKSVQNAGCVLTLVLTIPILGLVTLGIPGLLIGVVVGSFFLYGMYSKKAQKQINENNRDSEKDSSVS